MVRAVTAPRLIFVYVALLVLLALTAALARVNLGGGNVAIALVIALFKAGLIVTWFMNLRHAPPVMRLAALAAIFWLGILLVLALGDYVSRGWVPGTSM